jgi:hypothetical protein
MKIMEYLRETFIRVVDITETTWSRLQEQGPEMAEKVVTKIGGFFTSPLGETEYALLKRVSGIMGTAAAVYLIYMAGIQNALVLFGLCLILAFGLYKLNGLTLNRGQESQ